MSTPNSPLPVTRRAPIVRSLASLAIAALAIACGPSASPSASGSPSSGGSAPPSTSPSTAPASSPSTTGAIEHKTGATDVVLRAEQGGGFVPIDFLASQAPTFTLYGDGVVVFQPRVDQFPQPDANGVTKSVAWRTAKLDEDQVQDLLEYALGQGGLGAAKDVYLEGGIADAPSTIFTVRAGGLDKTVTVNALMEQPNPGPDALIRTGFWKLWSRLADFDNGGAIATDVYTPDRYRAVLIEREDQPGVKVLDWPWPSIPFAEFKEGPQDGSGPTTFPHRTLAAADAAALAVGDIPGGVQGLTLKASNGKLYSLVLRPLLADETE